MLIKFLVAQHGEHIFTTQIFADGDKKIDRCEYLLNKNFPEEAGYEVKRVEFSFNSQSAFFNQVEEGEERL